MKEFNRSIDSVLDNLTGGGFFYTSELPWLLIIGVAFVLAWVVWVTLTLSKEK